MSTDTRCSLLSTLPKDIPASFLKQITNDFSPKLELGKGAFGTVYQGIAENGEMIAVKKLGENCPVADKTFSNEKKVVQHNGRYIIVDIAEIFLCYEYLPKGSLDNYLFGRRRKTIRTPSRPVAAASLPRRRTYPSRPAGCSCRQAAVGAGQPPRAAGRGLRGRQTPLAARRCPSPRPLVEAAPVLGHGTL
ncbi:unnamed protein product [Miscanthus lutarioriparius]|uniref:Serine-threonine/tyrosine-protein kinase catalytic domain-containing protein n=1 Tax=Miscanthus lutarioriparius TaxID=422564 RepID=A0A811QMC0_9POAL|nr:unnamed protein product [Miscanthus lutarioriparius]